MSCRRASEIVDEMDSRGKYFPCSLVLILSLLRHLR